MRSLLRSLIVTGLMAFPLSLMAVEGMVTVKSKHSAEATADKLVSVLEDKGMTVMNRINHTEGAKSAGLELKPTEVVIFGNPKVGTPLMQCSRSVAIDMPQKALIWEDDYGDVWLSYNDPEYLKQRHKIEGCDGVIAKIAGALKGFATVATE